MPITEAQRLERRKGIGSSDVPIILGLSPWRNVADLWLEKTGRIPDEDEADPDGHDVRYIGNRLEDGVLDFATDQLGPLIRNVTKAVNGVDFPFTVNTDAAVVADEVPVEAKTSGILRMVKDGTVEAWGDEETDQVPYHIIAQCHAHMLAHGKQVCHVPALIGGRGFCMFHIPWNQGLGDLIVQKAGEFWKMVKEDRRPEDIVPHLEIVKRLRKTPEKIVDVPEAVVQAMLDATKLRKAAEDAEDAAKARLLDCMSDAEAATAGNLGAFTNFLQKRGSYVAKATEFRVLRYKPKGL
jgi:putative phage-type endonuclease